MEVLKAREGQWLIGQDFKDALAALGEPEDKYISNKLYNLKKKDGVESVKNGRTASYRYTSEKAAKDAAARASGVPVDEE